MSEPSADYASRRDAHLAEMEAWLGGARSWMNFGPNEPYTPDVIAVMDAQEVVKYAAAAVAYGLLAAQIDSSGAEK